MFEPERGRALTVPGINIGNGDQMELLAIDMGMCLG